MINDFELANISKDIYREANPNKDNKGYADLKALGIEIIKVSGNSASSSGFFAALVKKDSEYGIAIRGTDVALTKPISSVGDIYADFLLAIKEIPKAQVKEMEEFIASVKQEYKIAKIDFFTGHSQGGVLATK